MKLLMVSGDRSVLGGKKGAFWYTLEEFSKQWDRIDIICPRVEQKNGTKFLGNVEFHPSPFALPWQPWWIASKGRELIDAHNHDVMTVHEYPPFYNGLGARALLRRCGIPYALEIHHIVGHPIPSSLSERIGYYLSRLYLPGACRRSSMVRVVNHSMRSLLLRWGVPLEKIGIVPSFYLDAEVLKPDHNIQKQYDLSFCGRLVSSKGLMELLSALRSIPKATLLVIGDGPERKRCESAAAQWGIGDRVTFRGWLPSQQDVIAAIQSASVFVMNSRSEGGPRVALEAMACGMPIIATPVGVMPEVVQSGVNGLLVTTEERHLADAIGLLLRDAGLRNRLGRAAAEVIKRFERRSSIAAYAKFLQHLSAVRVSS